MRNEARGTNRQLATRRWRLAVAAVVIVAVAACTGDDDGGSPASTESDDTRSTTTSTTQAPASEAAAVRWHLQDLLTEWDGALTPILADPQAVVGDPDHRLRAELAEFFTADSPYVQDLDAFLDGYISQDAGVRAGPSGLAQQSTLVEINGVTDADHVAFVFCSFADGPEFVLSTGEERSPTVRITQGAGEATRVDGVWILHRLRQLSFDPQPPGTVNPCPGLAADGQDA